MVPAGTAAEGAQLSPQEPLPHESPQHELVGSQQKRLRNSRCNRPSRLQVSQPDVQVEQLVSQVEQVLQVMLRNER